MPRNEHESGDLVPHTGFEPVVSALRGRCPRPLDECGTERRRHATRGPVDGRTMIPNDRRARWRAAEELGFDDAWTFDHLGFGALLDAPWYGAVPTLAAAASVTSSIRL